MLLAQQPAVHVFIKSNERSEYSHIGLADFCLFIFSRKSLKDCSLSILIFRGLT